MVSWAKARIYGGDFVMNFQELKEQLKQTNDEYLNLKADAVIKKIKFNDLVKELNWQWVEVNRYDRVYNFYISPHVLLDFQYDDYGYVKIVNSAMASKFYKFLETLTEFEDYVVKL